MLRNKVEYGGCMAREIKKGKLRLSYYSWGFNNLP